MRRGVAVVLVSLLLLPGGAFALQSDPPSAIAQVITEIEHFFEYLFAPFIVAPAPSAASAAAVATAEPDTSAPPQPTVSGNQFTATSTNDGSVTVESAPPPERTVYLQPQTIERTVVQQVPATLPDDLVHTSLLAQLLATVESQINEKLAAIKSPPPFPEQVAAGGNGVFSYGAAAAASSGGGGGGGSGGGVSLDQVNNIVASAIQTALSAIDHLTANTITATNSTLGSATATTLHVTGATTLDTALAPASGGTSLSTAPSYGQLLMGQANGTYALVSTSSLGIPGGTGIWGAITGSIANQTDLQNALNAKLSVAQWYATTTSALAEGNNLYFTNARADARINATSSIGTLLAAPQLASVGTITSGTWDAAAIGIAYGGTGLATAPSYGQLLLGQSNGTFTLVSTSSLGITGGGSSASSTLLSDINTFSGANTFSGVNSFTNTGSNFAGTLSGLTASQLIGLGFSTTSATYFITNNQGLAFSTTSANYFLTGAQGLAFSTTSASYFLSQNQGTGFATTSAVYFVSSSTTIPRSYAANTFTNTNTFGGSSIFTGALTVGTLNGPLQANDGVISATSSIGVLYGGTGLATAPSYGQLLLGQSNGTYALISTSSLGLGTGAVSPGTQGQSAFYNANGTTVTATSSLFLAPSGYIGIGTTTPWARLSIDTSNLPGVEPEFTIGSPTRQDVIVDQSGNVGIGTTSPFATLSINGTGFFSNSLTAPLVDNGGQVVNVKAFGAKGDGVTNDHPAFTAAFTYLKSIGGGTLYIPPGTYNYVTDSDWSTETTFNEMTSSVIIEGAGQGATIINFTGGSKGLILGETNPDINRYCTAPPNTGCTPMSWGLPHYKLINDITTGGNAITVKNLADAAAFAPGDTIFIESGDASPTTGHPPMHWEYNKIASVDTVTGVIKLQDDLLDQYDSSNPTYPPMAAVLSSVPSNITVRDLTITSSENGPVMLATISTMDNTIERVSFISTKGNGYLWNSYSWRTAIRNSSFDGIVSDLGDAGRFWNFTDNVMKNVSDNLLTGGGSARDYYIARNRFFVVRNEASSVQLMGIILAGADKDHVLKASHIVIEDNQFTLSGTVQWGGAVSLYNIDGAVIAGNTIVGTSASTSNGTAIVLSGNTTNTQVFGNNINSTYENIGIQLNADSGTSPSFNNIHDNYINVRGTGVYIADAATESNIIGCNQFSNTLTDIADYGTGTIYRCGSVNTSTTTTTGFIPYWDNSSSLSGTSSIFFSFSFIGIGTTSPGSLLSLGGIANFTTATSSFYSSGGINLTGGGCFSINGNCIGGGGGSGTVSAGTQGQFAFYNTSGTTLSPTSNLFLAQSGDLGVNNVSPAYPFDVAGFINTDMYSGFKQAGNTVLYASTTNYSLALGASDAAAWMSASSTLWESVAVGQGALATAPTSGGAGLNSAFGAYTLHGNATGWGNTAIGYSDLGANNSGSGNTAAGTWSLANNTSGSNNIAIGLQALQFNTSGWNNIANGGAALNANTTGSYNVAVGHLSLYFNTTGSSNVAGGTETLEHNDSATNTVALGYRAAMGSSNYDNQGGTYVGYQSGYSAQTGSDFNTLLGYQAGYDISTGNNNLILGTEQSTGGGVTTGSNNILIGNGVNAGLNQGGNNQLNIGNLIFGTGLGTGNSLATGNVGIGTTSPDMLLTVGGNVPSGSVAHFENSTGSCYINPTTTSLSCSSDARLKTNVVPLDSADGLAALLKLNPVTFNWKSESATSSPHTGFIAQDVQPVLPDLVSQGPDGFYSLNYAGFVPYLVKAVQEIATVTGTFQHNLIAFLGSASNGLTDLFAGTGHFNQLCVSDSPTDSSPLCLTKSQLAALLSQSAASSLPTSVTSSGTSQVSNLGSSGTGNSTTTNADSTPPAISINGANPASITVGSSYADLGATITGPKDDLNLGIIVVVDNATSTDGSMHIDTAKPGTHSILYTVTDQNGLTGSATRTVIVSAPQQPLVAANDHAPAASSTSDTALSITGSDASIGPVHSVR